MTTLSNPMDLASSHPQLLFYRAKKSLFSRSHFRHLLTVSAIELRQKDIELTFEEAKNLFASIFSIKVYASNADIIWFEEKIKESLQ